MSINSPSGRFRLSEDSESLYSYVITLTIHGVKESDLGNYTCGARNSYGTVKGAISLESKAILKFISSRCLKITEKVSFNIANEASYVYLLSGQKFITNTKNAHFGEFLKT